MYSGFDQGSWLNLTIRKLMDDIRMCFISEKKMSDDLLATLHAVFPLHSVAALDLIDHRSVSLISSPSGRKIYSCLGSSGTPYLICYTGFTCTCPSFRNNFSIENLWCKHLLALQLSEVMGLVQEQEVSEDMMMSMLSDMNLCDD